jgi:alkylation response protein AidB-like acyl-CoA dehydrogenase
MNLAFSEEQSMLRDSVGRFFERDHAPGTLWPQFAEMGWLAIPLGEAHGGLGGSMVDVGIVMEGLGRARSKEPFLSTVVLAAGLVERLGTVAQCAELLPRIADGSLRMAVAMEPSPGSRSGPCFANRHEGGFRLNGELLAHDGPSRDAVLVIASMDEATQGVFLLRRESAGVQEQAFPTLDGRPACILHFDNAVPEQWLGERAVPPAAIERECNRAVAAACAEAVGSIRTLVDTTVAYAKTRVQFGRPIGENQVVKHRLVDMLVQAEEARAITLRALLLCEGEGGDAATSGARLKVARCAAAVAEQAIQLHGAMGVTEELDVGDHVKRLLAFEMRLGSQRHHMERRVRALEVVA